MKILFINHNSLRCGVADYGRRVFDILSPHMDITYCDTEPNYDGYDIALYNYHYATMPNVTHVAGIKQIALFHEAHLNFQPDQVINVSDLPRPLLPFRSNFGANNPPCIGSFGFGFPDKNFPRICELVKEQFTEATVRLNIPFAEFGDNDGSLAMQESNKCREILANTLIKLEVGHQFWSQTHTARWLSGNDINLFLYKPSHGRGVSSVIDYALSAKRPIGISNSEMFRHLPREICVANTSIPELIKKGIEPLKKVYEENSNEKFVSKIKELIG